MFVIELLFTEKELAKLDPAILKKAELTDKEKLDIALEMFVGDNDNIRIDFEMKCDEYRHKKIKAILDKK